MTSAYDWAMDRIATRQRETGERRIVLSGTAIAQIADELGAGSTAITTAEDIVAQALEARVIQSAFLCEMHEPKPESIVFFCVTADPTEPPEFREAVATIDLHHHILTRWGEWKDGHPVLQIQRPRLFNWAEALKQSKEAH